MAHRWSNANNKCFGCINTFKYYNFSDGSVKCCPNACLKNCTAKTKKSKSCADCNIAGQVWDDETGICINISQCTGIIFYDVCYKLLAGVSKEEIYYDKDTGEIMKRTCSSPQVVQDGQCTNSCKSGYILDGSVCKQCTLTDCEQCDTLTTCKKCLSGKYLQQTDKTCGICDQTKGYYSDSNYNCYKCNPICQTCTDNSLKCTKCVTGKYKNPITQECGECDLTSAKYINGEICSVCDSSCLQCSGSATNCKSCSNDNYFQEDTQICAPCDKLNGYYIDSNNKCRKCNPVCQTCTDNSLKCTKCVTGKYKNPVTQECGDCDLTSAKYINGEICSVCDSSCLQCSGSATNCKSCSSDNYFQEDTQICAPCDKLNGYYIDINNKCRKCNPVCQTCTDNSLKCTKCVTGKYKNPITQECGDCDLTSAKYINGEICSFCDSSCLQCSGSATNCKSCSNDNYFQEDTQICAPCDKLNGYYIDINNRCRKCNPVCQTCTDNSLKCKKCITGKYKNPITEECGDCLTTNSKYTNGEYCQQCDSTCQQCNESAKSCIQCSSGNYFQEDTQICGSCNYSNGYFLDSNSRCRKCDITCKSCSLQKDQCIECATGKNKKPNSNLCVDCNEDGWYIDKSNNQCLKCSDTCKTCKDTKENCSQCAEGLKFIGSGNQCAICNISQQKYDNNGRCEDCHPNCQECTGNLINNCIKCAEGFLFVDENRKKCDSCDLSQNYFNNNGVCTKCHIACSQCTGPNSNQCKVCASGYLFAEGTTNECIQCDFDNRKFDKNGTCTSCSQNCQKCNGPNADQCTQCIPTMKFIGNTQNCDNCKTDQQKYIDGDHCRNCDPSCQECSGPSIDQCTKCVQDKYLQDKTFKCDNCATDNKKFIDTQDNNRCKSCHDSCLQCQGPYEDNCTKCPDQRFFIEGTKKCDTCDKNQKKFIDPTGKVCMSCHSSCQTCIDNSPNCSTCINGFYFKDDTQICEECQLSNQRYIDIGTKRCYDCDSTCQTCSGKSETKCESCIPGKYFLDGKCQNCDIQNGYYIQGNNCLKCPENCKNCSEDPANKCTVCMKDFYFLEEKCQTCNIALGYYIEADKYCKKCNTKCKTCTGPLESDCNDCPENTYFQRETKVCGACDTQNKKFLKNNRCYDCHPNCQSCRDEKETSCNSCIDTLYSKDNLCILCEESKGLYKSDRNCYDCDSTCKTCENQATQCKFCSDGKSFIPNSKQCRECKVNIKEFIDSNNICQSCHESCLTCNGLTKDDCKTCADTYFFSSKAHVCVKCDLNQQKYLTTDNKCDDCSPNCQTCNGSNNNNCKSCIANKYFQEDTGICDSCDLENNHYLDLTNICRKCHSTCKKCSAGDENSCKTCQDLHVFKLTDDNKKICVVCNLENKEFIDSSDNYCKKCGKNCQKCNGLGDEKCTQCVDNTFFQEENHYCVECDPLNKPEFIDTTNPSAKKCKQCHNTCKACEQFGADKCKKCKDGLYFNEQNECKICDTQNGYFIDGEKCKKCDISCKKCDGPNSNNCMDCPANKYFEEDSRVCVECLEGKGYYIESGLRCRKCHDYCKKCSDKTPKCETCKDGYNFRNLECIKCDQQGFFIDNTDKICKKCKSNCKNCDGETDNSCTECADTLIFKENSKSCITCDETNKMYIQTDPVTSIQRCFPCHNTCYQCKGQLETDCKKCIDGLSFTDGKCKGCNKSEAKYIDSANICKDCSPNCQTCTGGTKGDCNSCKTGFYFLEGILTNGCETCDTTNGYYIDGIACRKCDSSCSKCNGAGPKKCLACQNPVHKLMAEDNSCGICDLTLNFYIDVNDENKCKKCHSDCKTCDAGLDSKCKECAYPYTYRDNENKCKKCHSDCQTCSGPNIDECTKCIDSKKFISIQNNTCQVCQSNETNDGQKCLLCPANCSSCKQTNKCDTCKPGFPLKSDGQCGTCGESEYPDPNTNSCQKCDNSCQSCTGPKDTECKKCKDSKSIRLDTKQCGLCEANQYTDNDNKCQQCFDKCASCNGSKFDQCLSCIANFNFNGDTKECIKCQTDNKFYIDNTNRCRQCNPTCQTCSGNQINQCLSCPPGSSFIGTPITGVGGQCSVCDLTNGKFVDKASNSCLDCSKTCKTCIGSSEKECIECKDGLNKRKDLDNICQKCELSDGFYIDNADKECKKCHDLCQTCSGSLNTQCTQCKDPTFKFNEKTNVCEPCDTTKNFYVDGQFCRKCHADCKTCTGGAQKDCKDCVYERNFFDTNHICQQCHQDCAICNGTTEFDCQKCLKKDFYLSIGNKKKCIQCEYNQYNDGTSCQNCLPKCAKCADGAKCQVCERTSPKRKDGTCDKCDDNQYTDSKNECQNCHTDCSSCTGPGQNECKKCSDPNKFIRMDTKICGNCDSNQYGESSICKNCHQDCAECSGPLDSQCKKCANSTNFNCYNNDVTAFTKISPVSIPPGVEMKCLKSCLKCHQNCETCFGEGINQCMKCKVGILQEDLSCSKKCPKGKFFDEQNVKCSDCKVNCLECSGLNECQVCQLGFTLYEGECFKCDLGKFLDKKSKSCRDCHESCKSCNEGSEKDCIECKNSDYFFDQNNICVNKCQEGYIKNPHKKKCQECAYKMINEKKECVLDCGLGQYVNPTTRMCQNCFKDCTKCQDAKTCDECIFGMSFIDDKRESCQKCQIGYFPNPKTNICIECPQNNCDICTIEKCKKCSHEYKLYQDGLSCVYDNRYKVYKCDSKDDEECEKEIEIINKTDVSMKSVQITSTIVQVSSTAFFASGVTFGYTLQMQQLIGNFIVCDDLKQISLGPTFIGQSFSMNILNIFPNPFSFQEESTNNNDKSKYQVASAENSKEVPSSKRNLQVGDLLSNNLKGIHSRNLSKQFLNNVMIYFFLLAGLLLILKSIDLLSKRITFFQHYSDKKFTYLIWFNTVFSNFLFISIFRSFQYLEFTNWINILSFVIQCIYIIFYAYFAFILFKKVLAYDPRYIDREELPKFCYLIQSINLNSPFQKYFWFIFEARKIISLIFLFFIENKIVSCSLTLALNLLFLAYFMYWKPFSVMHQQRYYLAIEIMNIWINLLISIILATHYKPISWVTLASLWLLNSLILIYSIFSLVYTIHIIYCKKRFIVKTNYYYEEDVKMQKFKQDIQKKNKRNQLIQSRLFNNSSQIVSSNQSLDFSSQRSIENQIVVEQLDDIQQLSIKWNVNPIYARQIALHEVSSKSQVSTDKSAKNQQIKNQ